MCKSKYLNLWGIGCLNPPSNAVCYAGIQVWYPCAVKTVGRIFKRPASIGLRISTLVQPNFRHMQTGESGIWQFRKFFVSLVWHSWKHPRQDVVTRWKTSIHMDEQGMLQGTRNKTGASQPLLSEGMVSSIVGNPFQRLWHFSAKQSAMPSLIFMGKYSNNGGRRPKADPSVNRYVVRFNVEENARFLSISEQSEDINKAAFIKNFLFSESFHGLCCRWKHTDFSSISCPRWMHSIELMVAVTTLFARISAKRNVQKLNIC